MKYFTVYALIFSFFLQPALSAQETDDLWYLGKPIADIRFEGIENVKLRDVRSLTRQFIQTEFTEEQFLELQSRLYALDFFEQVIPRAELYEGRDDAVVIVFNVIERPIVEAIEVKGNRKVSKGEIRSTILLKAKDFVSPTAIRADEARLRELYITRGFTEAKIQVQFDDTVNTVVITVEEGYEIRVTDIQINGNESISDRKIRRTILTKKTSLFEKGRFQQRNLEEDKNRIEQLYQEDGFLDAQVYDTKIEVSYDQEKLRRNLVISYLIEEGAQFFFGGATFSGNTIFESQYLESFITLKTGDLLNAVKWAQSLQAVAEQYQELGYVFSEFNTEEGRNGQFIVYKITIVERDRAHLENIIITGNEKTRDGTILREIPMEPGEVFNAVALRRAYFNLTSLQYFSAINVSTPQGSAENLLDVEFAVEEQSTTNINFGISFGGGGQFPISALLRWTDTNFLGRGFRLQATGNFAPTSQELELGFYSDWVGLKRIGWGLSFFFTHSTQQYTYQDNLPPYGLLDPFTGAYVATSTVNYGGRTYLRGEQVPVTTSQEAASLGLVTDYEFAEDNNQLRSLSYLMTYEEFVLGLAPVIGYTFRTPIGLVTPSLAFGFRFKYLIYDDLLYRPANAQTRNNLHNWIPVNSLTPRIRLDNRDIRFSPSKGYFIEQSLSLYGGFLFGSRHFSRSDTRAEVYFTLFDWQASESWAWKLVLGLNSSFSILFPYFSFTGGDFDTVGPADSDYLALDGIFIARGWPREIGGEAIWNSWIELRMPLSEQIIWFDIFLEAATLWRERETIGMRGFHRMKYTFGAGIRFVIPQFPIRLYFAKRFLVDRNMNVQWQTGNVFSNDTSGSGVDLVFSFSLDLLRP